MQQRKMELSKIKLLGAEEEIDEAYEEYLRTNVAREDELIKFVEEFLNSEEFFAEQRRTCAEDTESQLLDISVSDCVCVECWVQTEEVKLSRAALIKRAQRLWATERRFENYLKHKASTAIIRSQEKGISVIRHKISEAKKKYFCHKQERDQLKEKQREEVLEDLKTKYNVNTTYLKTKSKPVEKVLVYNKIRVVQRYKRKTRMVAIIKKILSEYRRQREIDDLKNRRYDTKVLRKEKILEDVDVAGTKIKLLPRFKPQTEEAAEEKEEKHEWEDIPEPEIPKGKGKGKGKGEGKAKGKDKDKAKVKADKAPKKAKDKKEKTKEKQSKKSKVDKEETADLVLPYVPITNERLKVKADEKQNLGDLISEFNALGPIVEEREKYNIQKELLDGVFYPTDVAFSWSPKNVEFQGFKNGVTYKKKLNILNGGSVEKKCRFYLVKLEEFDPTLIQVEPVGSKHLIPGLPFNITVTFKPTILDKAVKGKIFFLTYQSSKNEYRQIGVPLICIPWCSNISIIPETILFGSLPIWEAKKMAVYKNYKTLKITNTGRKPCKIVITKIRNPFEQDEDLGNSTKATSTLADKYDITFIKEKENQESDGNFHLEEKEGYELYVPLEATEEMMKEEIQQCIEGVFNSFTFKCYCFDVNSNSENQVKVYFRNIDYVGSYCEKYLISVFEQFAEKVFNCVGSQELTVQGELTGHFIEVKPDNLDFDVCVFNSVYQLSFIVHNNAHIAHGVGVKFPSSLKSYLSCSENDVYIQPNGHKRISIRFIPRKNITIQDKVKYYNPETKILEFPIYVYVMSKLCASTPPIKVAIYAILTESNGLSIKPIEQKHTSYFNDVCEIEFGQCNCELSADYVIDMGECTIAETVYTDLRLANNSYVFQIYGFLDLPECVNIFPNYGFGEIFPLEVKTLTLAFTPEAKDIPNYAMECEGANNTITFRISANTIKNIGRIKKTTKPFNYKFIRASLETTEKELEREFPLALLQDMYACLDLLQNEDVIETLQLEENLSEFENQECVLENHLDRSPVSEDICREEETPDLLHILSNRLWIKATIIDPLCDFSHQHVEFPDTPCGSYSAMTISLRALSKLGDFDCACNYAKKFSKCKTHLQFVAHYEIVGDNPEFTIEPTCGDLETGQTIKLTLVAQPQLSKETVMTTAREIKIEQLLQRKREEWEIKRQKELAAKLAKEAMSKGKKGKDAKGKKDQKDKKDKKGKVAEKPDSSQPTEPKPEPIPEFVIEEHEIVIDYLDLYPAEMVTWKNMEFYFIEANFCCTLSYVSDDFLRKPEKLYLTAACKVIKPDFIHNMKTQHIAFGPTVMGMITKKILAIQNIQCKPIDPTVTLLSPTGFFTCPSPKNLKLPPEHILQIPLTFTPSENQEAIEYFEIKAGSTICPFIVSGKGVEPNFTISPDFVVCRLEANSGAFADCSLEINNLCEAPLIINFVKVCELEGEIKPIEEKTNTSDAKKEKTKQPDKGKKDDKKPKKISKFSQELTNAEEVSLQNYFVPKNGESYFEILGGTSGEVTVEQFTKKSVKIRFGVPLPPGQKDEKGKNKGKSKKPKSSSKGSKGPLKYYVSKYNIMLGKSTFLRDAIVVATFI